MWSLLVVGIYFTNSLDSRTTGSVEFRFKTKEECMETKDRFDKIGQIKNNRLLTSCSFKSYL